MILDLRAACYVQSFSLDSLLFGDFELARNKESLVTLSS